MFILVSKLKLDVSKVENVQEDQRILKSKQKTWNFIKVFPKYDQILKPPVPKNVPPLDRHEVEDCSSALTPRSSRVSM